MGTDNPEMGTGYPDAAFYKMEKTLTDVSVCEGKDKKVKKDKTMKKPWDETWGAFDTELKFEDKSDFPFAKFDCRDGFDYDRTRLAAEAPAMWRLLMEWEYADCGHCPSCDAHHYESPTHLGTCKWLRIAKSIGYVPNSA